MKRPVEKAIVIGDGIGGLTAAIALKRAGIRVAVFEQAPLGQAERKEYD